MPAWYAPSPVFSSLALFVMLLGAAVAKPTLRMGFTRQNAGGTEYHLLLSNYTWFQVSPKAIVSDACASYSTLERLNRQMKPAIEELTQTTDFFSHFRLNLFHKSCPFWNDENGMCGNIACAVETLENEEDIPPVWRASQLGKLEGPRAEHPGKRAREERPQKPLQGSLGEGVGESCVVEYDDECDERDYCVRDDEGATSKGDYVSLLRNPERFTGYGGEGAKQVWDAIYRENCFQTSSFPRSAGFKEPSLFPKNPAAMDFKAVIDAAGRQQILERERQANPLTPFVAMTGLENEDQCLEKRVFYRVISGMHASISTHLCWEFLNQTTGLWQPNVSCYVNRLHNYPERIGNLYFNYALVTRAAAKLKPYLADSTTYKFCTGDAIQDKETRAKVLEVAGRAASVPQIFDESLMFKNGEGPSLKEDFRERFRNVSRLMDCVGCDKCRLWGKLQTAGYGAALKVLFESDNNGAVPVLKRTELVALFNTYARLSSSMSSIMKFREMVTPEVGPEQSAGDVPDQAEKPIAVVPEMEEAAAHGKRKSVENRTLKGEFDDELRRVLKAFKIVIKTYRDLPANLYRVACVELKRLWQGYVGLPVTPRTWTFQRPSLDEL